MNGCVQKDQVCYETRVLTEIAKKELQPESILKIFSPLERLLIDIFFERKSAIGLRRIRNETIKRLYFTVIKTALSVNNEHSLANKIVVFSSANEMVQDSLESSGLFAINKVLKDIRTKLLTNEYKATGTDIEEIEQVLVANKLMKIPGFSTIKNAIHHLEIQGIIISIVTENFKTDRLYTLSPVFDSYLREKNYYSFTTSAISKASPAK